MPRRYSRLSPVVFLLPLLLPGGVALAEEDGCAGVDKAGVPATVRPVRLDCDAGLGPDRPGLPGPVTTDREELAIRERINAFFGAPPEEPAGGMMEEPAGGMMAGEVPLPGHDWPSGLFAADFVSGVVLLGSFPANGGAGVAPSSARIAGMASRAGDAHWIRVIGYSPRIGAGGEDQEARLDAWRMANGLAGRLMGAGVSPVQILVATAPGAAGVSVFAEN